MLLKLWNFIRGYVVIEVYGFSVERFVNLATFKGVYIWDMVYSSKGVRMKVSIKAFRLLKVCAKKTKCKIRIVDKVGYPFFVHKYRKRKILFGGIAFFVLGLYFLSSFIWLIEINGNDRVTNDMLLKFSKEQGLKIGAFKFNIDTKKIENNIIAEFSDISWININITGTKVTLDLSEIIPKQQLVDRSTPSDLIAEKDGLITSIVTSAGTPQVKENDVVAKGDILVKGELVINEDENGKVFGFVHSTADIWAKMYYEFNYNVPYIYYEKSFTGKVKNIYKFLIFDKLINVLSQKVTFTNYNKVTSRKQLKLTDNYPFPFILIREQYIEFNPVEKTYSAEQAREISEKILTNRIIREFDFEVDIIDKKIMYSEGEDQLNVNAIVTTVERIGQNREIDMSKYEEIQLNVDEQK